VLDMVQLYHGTYCRNEERMGHRQELETLRGLSRQGIGVGEQSEGRSVVNVGEDHRQVRQRTTPKLDEKIRQSPGCFEYTLPGVHDSRGG